jgi:hypothetical protein
MSKAQIVYPFIIVLRNRNRRAVHLTGGLVSVISIILLAIRANEPAGSGLNLLVAGICMIFFLWNVQEHRSGRASKQAITLAIAGAGMILVPPFSWTGLLLLALARIESEALKPLEIGFAEDHIRIGGWRPKRIPWSQLSNVVLRDGLLTIDYIDNRLFQREADDLDDEEYDGTEDEFNVFCRRQLDRSRSVNHQ